MREAIETTIEDFRIELNHLSPSDFRMKYYLESQIELYEKKLSEFLHEDLDN